MAIDVIGWARARSGWLGRIGDLAHRVLHRVEEDRAVIAAAGLGFYAFLALLPAIVAIVSLYTLVTDPAELVSQVQRLTDSTPQEVQRLVVSELLLIADRADSGVSLWLLAGLVVWFWGASRFAAALIQALNTVYGITGDRGPLHRRLVSLGVTLAMVLIGVVGLGLGKAGSRILELPDGLSSVASLARWPVLFALVVVGLAVTYRFAPDREDGEFRLFSPGVLVGAGLFVLTTAAYTIYMTTFGGVSSFYGSFGGLVGLQLWLLVSAFAILLGAYVDIELGGDDVADRSSAPGRAGADR